MLQKNETGSTGQNISGFLKARSDWNETVAAQIAEKEGLVLTDRHWDIIHFVRTEFYANHGIVPLERDIKSGMEREWGVPVRYTDLQTLFPGGFLQGAKIAGCVTLTTVADLLGVKGDTVWSISSDQAVIEALSLLAEKNIGALMVVDNRCLVGVVSERDFTRDVLLTGKSPTDTSVGEIMSVDIVSVSPACSLEECMSLMVEKRFRHLPVLNDGSLVGVLSMPDLVKVIVDQQQTTISRLQN